MQAAEEKVGVKGKQGEIGFREGSRGWKEGW